eukprot:scaffold22596_cov65-Cyclotella_meneghiniana.AAC.3
MAFWRSRSHDMTHGPQVFLCDLSDHALEEDLQQLDTEGRRRGHSISVPLWPWAAVGAVEIF